jgi:hypothetical protein
MLNRPKMLSYPLIGTLLKNEDLYKQLPEFSQLKAKVKTAKPALAKSSCCGGRKRAENNGVVRDFVQILNGLSDDRLNTFKQIADASKLMYSYQDPKTGQFSTLVI